MLLCSAQLMHLGAFRSLMMPLHTGLCIVPCSGVTSTGTEAVLHIRMLVICMKYVFCRALQQQLPAQHHAQYPMFLLPLFTQSLYHCMQDLEYDRRLQEVPRLLPSSLSLPAITAGEYCVSYVQQLRHVLHKNPPNQPTEMAIDMLAAVAQLQR